MSDPPFNLIPRPRHKSKPWEEKCSCKSLGMLCCELMHELLASLEKYHTIGSWFLGPRGENAGIMKEKMNRIVDHVNLGRISFGHKDEVHLVPLSCPTSQINRPRFPSCRTSSPQRCPNRWISKTASPTYKLALTFLEKILLSTLCLISPRVTPRT